MQMVIVTPKKGNAGWPEYFYTITTFKYFWWIVSLERRNIKVIQVFMVLGYGTLQE